MRITPSPTVSKMAHTARSAVQLASLLKSGVPADTQATQRTLPAPSEREHSVRFFFFFGKLRTGVYIRPRPVTVLRTPRDSWNSRDFVRSCISRKVIKATHI